MKNQTESEPDAIDRIEGNTMRVTDERGNPVSITDYSDIRWYSTRNECVEREIVAAIEFGAATANEYDLDAISEELVVTATTHDDDDIQIGNVQYGVVADPDRF